MHTVGRLAVLGITAGLLGVACATTVSPGPDATVRDAAARSWICIPEGPAADGGCYFPSGRWCPPNASCPADDECNGCRCSRWPDGAVAPACNLAGCRSRIWPCNLAWLDCRLPSGRWCRSQRCVADDGCNLCDCLPDGTVVCTARVCRPAAGTICHGVHDGFYPVNECPPGQECVAAESGCDAPLRCAPAENPAPPRTYCACDGRTGVAYGRPRLPYAALGPCQDR